MCRFWRFWILAALLLQALPAASQGPRQALILEARGAIGPATADYLERGLAHAAETRAALVVIEMDTPGGLDSATRAIVRAILASPVPVATFVTPSGARAASAGTYILIASHIAAMAPGTNVGAATPVSLGGGMPGETNGDKARTDASEAKAISDSAAFLRSLAELRGRNADWAEAAVRESASLPAQAAAQQRVIDFVARDMDALLQRADGRTVTVRGAPATLETRGLQLERRVPDWRTRFLATITDPNIALILMMIGIYGLLFEFMNPGTVLPGTVGAIALLLGLYALAVLPIDYAGLALILLGLGLMVAEAFAPSFGVLGIGGVIAFILGGTILLDTEAPGFVLSQTLVVVIALTTLAFILLAVGLALRARRRPVSTGPEAMIGAVAEVADWRGRRGHVLLQGERWQAVGPTGLAPGDCVRVASVRGLTLRVEPAPAEPS